MENLAHFAYRRMLEERAKIDAEIFSSPPKTMEDFHYRRGRREAFDQIINEMNIKSKGLEES